MRERCVSFPPLGVCSQKDLCQNAIKIQENSVATLQYSTVKHFFKK